DVLSLLAAQGEVSKEGLAHLARWSATGATQESDEVRRCEHEADAARRVLLEALQAALSTPVDQEDLYVLSERLDRVVNAAKNTVREAEVLGWQPDQHAMAMGAALAEGTDALVAGLGMLRHDLTGAGRQADAATSAVRHVEHRYREAMTGLLTVDVRSALAAQDLYRRYVQMGEHVVAVSDRLWYAVLRGA
ncbi:MAG: DUF47 domain-containing protein, partial [Actinomycetes bacterium]